MTPARATALPRVLAAVAHTLESLDGADERLVKALELVRLVLPFEQAALLRLPRATGDVLVFPPVTDARRAALGERLDRLAAVLDGDAPPPGAPAERTPDGAHLAMPLVGLDELVGVLFVERDGEAYDEDATAALASIAAEIAAYLTLGRLVEKQSEAARELARAHEFQQLLIGNVSHDLRNPLSVITASAHQGRRSPAHLQRALDRIVASAGRANRIIHDLLDLTHARMGQGIPVDARPIDLAAVVADAVEDARVSHPARRIDLTRPPALLGEADPARLGQVLSNLLGNALRHGAVTSPIRVHVFAEAGAAVLRVHNEGAPIPSELRSSLFDPFRRGPRAAPSGDRGLGLGLYIVREIIARHGGQVGVTSTADEGTTFTVTLPGFVASDEAAVPPQEPEGARPNRILVVDDDHDIREALVELLCAEGYAATGACDGRDALRAMRAGPSPDLVLLDLMMPVMDGGAVIVEMREDAALADVPIVVISAGDRPAVAPGVEFLAKPVGLDTLLAAVSRARRVPQNEP